MRFGSRTVWLVVLCVLAGTVFQVAGSCGSLLTTGLLAGFDPCAILDCSGGIFGGAFNPCGDPANPNDNLFMRCP